MGWDRGRRLQMWSLAESILGVFFSSFSNYTAIILSDFSSNTGNKNVLHFITKEAEDNNFGLCEI